MDTKCNLEAGSKKSSDSRRHPWARMKTRRDLSQNSRDSAVFREPSSRPMIETVERYLGRGGAIKVCPALQSVLHETESLRDARVAREIVQGKIQMVVGF
ncbi:MAG: hypothetical protein ABTQ25_05400 [Nitrosomonas ureae]